MNKPSSTPAASPSKVKMILIRTTIALVLAAILYRVGLSQGRAQLAAQKRQSNGQIRRLQAQVDFGKQELATAQNCTRLLRCWRMFAGVRIIQSGRTCVGF